MNKLVQLVGNIHDIKKLPHKHTHPLWVMWVGHHKKFELLLLSDYNYLVLGVSQ